MTKISFLSIHAIFVYKEPYYTGLFLNGKMILSSFFMFYRNVGRANSESE